MVEVGHASSYRHLQTTSPTAWVSLAQLRAAQLRRITSERYYLDFMPLGRSGTREEIAGAGVYISRARWLTGEVLDLNGGAHFV